MLTDGTVFDQNIDTGKKSAGKRQLTILVKGREIAPLKFKVGTGKVIRGWDEALLTMVVGEQAKLTIEPQWAYGSKGHPDAYFKIVVFFLTF
jgi:FK506-binding protein 3